ncbi:MAG: DUF3592 domain-containing protein [Elusimicrobia bacterium]|nr:DUF3592 domain-containing protein [Elusimicrobiota bacterium]
MAKSKSRRSNVFEAFVLVFAGAVLLPLGCRDAEKQAERLATYIQTNASILSGAVREVQDDDGTEYCPRLLYRYVAEDRWLESGEVTPLGDLPCSSTRAKAEAVLKSYPPGMQLKAYVDPAQPGRQVFLLPRRSSAPYFMMLGGLVLLTIGLWLWDVRPRTGRAFAWVWSLYALAGVLIMAHERFSGPGWSLPVALALWAAHCGVPFILRAEPWDLSDD